MGYNFRKCIGVKTMGKCVVANRRKKDENVLIAPRRPVGPGERFSFLGRRGLVKTQNFGQEIGQQR